MTHRILNQHHDHHMKALKKSKFEPSKDRLHSILFIHESQLKGNLYQKYFQNHHLKCTNCYMTFIFVHEAKIWEFNNDEYKSEKYPWGHTFDIFFLDLFS